MSAYLQCIRPGCAAGYDLGEELYHCTQCGALLDVRYDWSSGQIPSSLSFFSDRWKSRLIPIDFSGVWRFRELLPFADAADLVTIGEGQTILQQPDVLRLDLPIEAGRLYLQYEGLNPSGSFKDNGMAAALTMARILNRPRVACASTGNTSASLALYASLTRLRDNRAMQAIVFIGAGKIAFGKLAQALEYGAHTIQIQGDFDACMKHIGEAGRRLGLYIMNSVNPFRLEGQKTIMHRVLEGLAWEVPDWIIVPGGNLGNTSAFGKAFMELSELGLIKKMPRLAVVNAAGADTLECLFNEYQLRWREGQWDQTIVDRFYRDMTEKGRKAATIASAIEIARPVNLPKALRALDALDGVVCKVGDEDILDEKSRIGRSGLGCEPASAASLAGLRQLLSRGIIDRDQRVVCILTGHVLKDPDATVNYHTGLKMAAQQASDCGPGKFANLPTKVDDDIEQICRLIDSWK